MRQARNCILIDVLEAQHYSRFRPPNALELREGGDIVVDFDEGESTTVKIKGGPNSGPEAYGFTFDHVFSMNARQQEVFEYGIKETVDGLSQTSIVTDILDLIAPNEGVPLTYD